MAQEKRKLLIGGVMRCCIATLDEYQKNDGVEDIGTVLPCKYCRSSLIVGQDGLWQWNQTNISSSGETAKRGA